MILGGTSSGTVTSNPAGITCAGAPVSCTGWFAEGATVTLTATPDTGLVFVGWAGVCMGTGTCQITVNGPQSVVAHFASPLQYYHLDVLGSVRMVTNAAGAVVKRHDYFAFGEDIAAMTGDPRRFTGKELDPETALQYFGARYYRNLWGRFTSVDPVMDLDEAVVDPQRWNRYSYVTNRPTQFVDPDGRNLLKWAYKIGKVIVKGGSLAAEFEGVLSDVDTLTSGESSIWAKAGALASLATEVVSPVSIRDGKGIVQMVVKRGDDAADSAKAGAKALPELRMIHSRETLITGSARFDYERIKKMSTDDIIRSLKPGAENALRVKADGSILEGNTRILVLLERGFDINSLPREIYK